jgi:hypothetical protein
MSFNPYEPPTSAYDGGYTNPNAGAVVSDRIVAALRKTRPWVTLLAVLGFIFGGLTALGSLAAFSMMPAIGFAYLVVAGIYIGVSVMMLKYSNAINKLLHGGGITELEEAIDAQASFWQLAGILTLIFIVLMVIGGVMAAAIGASMMNSF